MLLMTSRVFTYISDKRECVRRDLNIFLLCLAVKLIQVVFFPFQDYSFTYVPF